MGLRGGGADAWCAIVFGDQALRGYALEAAMGSSSFAQAADLHRAAFIQYHHEVGGDI
jgi:hypothetical protein